MATLDMCWKWNTAIRYGFTLTWYIIWQARIPAAIKLHEVLLASNYVELSWLNAWLAFLSPPLIYWTYAGIYLQSPEKVVRSL